MEKIDDDTLLMVISDHGFKSFARCMNLNAWLHQNGYLALKDGKTESGDWFEDVEWSRTRAYTMGLNGLYLNIKGREKQGIVDPAEAEALKGELQEKLNGLVDPASGTVGITGVFIADNVYRGPYTENSPDLIVGYGAGYRASWDSVMGKVTAQDLRGQHQGMERRPLHRSAAGSGRSVFKPQVHRREACDCGCGADDLEAVWPCAARAF